MELLCTLQNVTSIHFGYRKVTTLFISAYEVLPSFIMDALTLHPFIIPVVDETSTITSVSYLHDFSAHLHLLSL